MGMYCLKSQSFEASRWFKNGDHPQDYEKDREVLDRPGTELAVVPAAECRARGWEGQIVRHFRRPDVDGRSLCRTCGRPMHDHGWIDQGEDCYDVCPGDWVITLAPGLYAPCPHKLFVLAYAAVGPPAAPAIEDNLHTDGPATVFIPDPPCAPRSPTY